MKKRFIKGLAVFFSALIVSSALSVWAEERVSENPADDVWEVETDTVSGDLRETVTDEETADINASGDGEVDGLVYNIESDDSCTIIEYKGTASVVNLPSKLNGHKVKAIAEDVFRENTGITEVNIAAGVEEFGSYVFKDSTNLKKVTIGNGAGSLGYGAFDGCSSLSEISLPSSLTRISTDTFRDCSQLTKLTIPDNVTVIGENAFYGCSALSEIELSSNLEEICSGAFSACKSLKEIDFDDCKSLTYIRSYAFSGCTSLENVFVPDSVTSIGGGAFYNCGKLKNVKFSTEMKNLNSEIFSGCTSLKTVYIPKTIENIEVDCFEKNESVTDVYFGGTEDEWKEIASDSLLNEIPNAEIRYNYSEEDYLKKYKSEKNKENDDSDASVSKDSVSYNSKIKFTGKKIPPEIFGTITVSYDGTVYTASKIRINKKKKKIQITRITPENSKAQKAIRKMTKGNSGLDFTVEAYEVSDNSPVQAGFNKKNKLKSVKIELAGGKYKCKKSEYEYSSSANAIIFKGENLTGSYTCSANSATNTSGNSL